MQPEANIEKHAGGQERGDALGYLSLGAPDGDEPARNPPREATKGEGAYPPAMQVAESVARTGPDQEGSHPGQHEDGLESLPNDDDEGGGGELPLCRRS